MKTIFTKILYIMSFICIHNACAMESPPSLELRNGSKSPATVTIFYDIQGIKETVPSDIEPVTVTLEPVSLDGSQDQKKVNNPKRFGLVCIRVDGGIKFYNVVDLNSEITVGFDGTVFHSFKYSKDNVPPEWLFNSLTFKKFNLSNYCNKLSNKWAGLTEDQKKSPYGNDIPSCLHAIVTTPEMITPFPLCLSEGMRASVLEKYTRSHPEIIVSDQEIVELEKKLIQMGIPLLPH